MLIAWSTHIKQSSHPRHFKEAVTHQPTLGALSGVYHYREFKILHKARILMCLPSSVKRKITNFV
jgi:hypothetical protein